MAAPRAAPRPGYPQQPPLLKFRLNDIGSEGLHDVLVASGADRLLDVLDVVLGGAEDDDRHRAAAHPAQGAQELDAVHHRHIPVEQYGIGHLPQAGRHGELAVGRLLDGEFEFLEDSPGDFPYDARIVNDEAGLHDLTLGYTRDRPRQFRPLPSGTRYQAGA